MSGYSFLPEAEAEYLEAVRFYEQQRSELGEIPISEFERVIALITAKLEAWKIVHLSGIRVIGLSRFPYSVFYRVLDGEPQITAFAHHRRRPGYWLTRIV